MKKGMLNTVMMPEWMHYTASVLSVFAGFSARLAMIYQTGTITKKMLLIHVLSTVSLCFVTYIVKRDYNINFSIELLLCFVSFMGVSIIKTADEIAENGIKSYLKKVSDKYLGNSEEHDKEP